jgi:hypothetical protein
LMIFIVHTTRQQKSRHFRPGNRGTASRPTIRRDFGLTSDRRGINVLHVR